MGRPTSATGRLARYGFGVTDDEAGARAADLLGPDGLDLWRPQTQEPTGEQAQELLTALSRAADPDLALRQLHRLVEAERRTIAGPNGSAGPGAALRQRGAGPGRVTATAAGQGGAGSALLAELHDDPGLRRRLLAVLGASSALGDHLVANPDQWPVLRTEPDGLAPTADGRLDLSGDGNPVAVLRRAYRLALLRVAAADLTGGRGLEQTMAALSALADARCRPRTGSPWRSCPRAPGSRAWAWSPWASAVAAS